MLVPYRRPKRSYVLPVVTTLAVSAPLVALQLGDSTDYRAAGDSEFAAVPAQLAEVVLSSVPDITLPLRELTGLELPDLRLSDLRRLPLPASIQVPEDLPVPPGVELPRQIPLPRLDSGQNDPGQYSIPGQSPSSAPAAPPAANGQPAPAQSFDSTGLTPGPAAAVPGQTPPASGRIPGNTATVPGQTPQASSQIPGNTAAVPGQNSAPASPLPASNPAQTSNAPMAFDQSSVEALLGMIPTVTSQIPAQAGAGDPAWSAQSPARPGHTTATPPQGGQPADPRIPSTTRFVGDPADGDTAPGTTDFTPPAPGTTDFVGDPTAPTAQPIPGTGPSTTDLANDPTPTKPNGPIFGPETSLDTPALTPGAVSPEVLQQVGAQVKELSRETPFSVVALTAKDLAGTKALVRAKQPDGSWGPWYESEPVDTHRNDRGAASRTMGTEPIYVGATKAVQILVTRKDAVQGAPQSPAAEPAPIATPQGELQFPSNEEIFGQDVLSPLTAVLIDPGRGAIDSSLTQVAADLPGGGPNVISRAGWGADESIRCEDPTYDDFLGGLTVHHTAGRNDYDKSESAGIVRAIYAYHAKTLGWCDIGYNALVDKYGQIFEGRAGGLDKPVQGAHAGGFNENTSGVALMGNHVSEPPSDAAIDAVGRFVGWRSKVAGLNPQGSTVMESEGTEFTPIPQGGTINLPIVFAHRDVGNTTCPGDAAYAVMDRIREIAADAPGPAPRASQQQRKANSAPSNMGPAAPGPQADPQAAEDAEKLAALTERLLGMLDNNAIAKHWAAKGGANGPLGAPRSEPMPAARGGQYAKFVNGYVYNPPNGQVFEVAGNILDRFLELGGDNGMLGFPISNVYPVLNGLRSDFLNGSLIVNELNGIVTTVWKEMNADPYAAGTVPEAVEVATPAPAVVPAPAEMTPPAEDSAPGMAPHADIAAPEEAAPPAPEEWVEPEFPTEPDLYVD
uniref:N-acetylmuramoyl-L-alanine amidase n=1 Tax=Nocardia sp. XZ_19_385 TaxID=2769488 RepID=UPI001E2E9176|nr:N-acetylmuramoyl-L-alanine amidase [Nocardia sp. XZ_19_385]